MRIACLYLPSYPVQHEVRVASHLAGQSFAVSAPGRVLDRSAVVAVSRAAWSNGARVGMTPSQARAADPSVTLLNGAVDVYELGVKALAECLLRVAPIVDIGRTPTTVSQHRMIYLAVPPGVRGKTFGEKVLRIASRQGLRGRVGIADDRFASFVAAAMSRNPSANTLGGAPLFTQGCRSVPRGGSAAFLAPMPLGLLPLDPNVLSMLRSLGVRSLGDFASLPPPTIGCRYDDNGIDLQALARGDGPDRLEPFIPRGPVCEHIQLDQATSDIQPLLFLLRPLFDRVCARLGGRGVAADELALHLGATEIAFKPETPTLSPPTLMALARKALSRYARRRRKLVPAVATVSLRVIAETEPVDEELELFQFEGPRVEDSLRLTDMLASDGRHRRTRRGKRHRRVTPVEQPVLPLGD